MTEDREAKAQPVPVYEVPGADETRSQWTPRSWLKNRRALEILQRLEGAFGYEPLFGYKRGEPWVWSTHPTHVALGTHVELKKGDKKWLRLLEGWGFLERQSKLPGVMDVVYTLVERED